MLKTIKKAPERQSFSGVNSILPQRGKGILPTGVIVACPRGANSRGVSTSHLCIDVANSCPAKIVLFSEIDTFCMKKNESKVITLPRSNS